ncbi:MAG: biopolymer transporter ExbD [Planctomycetota bacterium]|jgi:biopolymer transport protein ExbD|nr:biopolymer transporter ExbD [Planctomycetota bacterium]
MGKTLAPLLDIILIVMTVFMVTAAVAIEKMGDRERVGPSLQFPKTMKDLSSKSGFTQKKSLTVSIKPKGKWDAVFYIENRRMSGERLINELEKRRPARIVLRVDGRVSHLHTAQILQLAEKLRFAVSFVTEP